MKERQLTKSTGEKITLEEFCRFVSKTNRKAAVSFARMTKDEYIRACEKVRVINEAAERESD